MDPTELQNTLAELSAEKDRIDALTKAYELVAKHQQLLKLKGAGTNQPGTTGSASDDIPVPHLDHSEKFKSMPKARRVRIAVEKAPNRFCIDDLMGFDEVKGMERNSVSFVLSAMKRKKQIFTIQQGIGATPSTYSKTAPSSVDQKAPDEDDDEI